MGQEEVDEIERRLPSDLIEKRDVLLREAQRVRPERRTAVARRVRYLTGRFSGVVGRAQLLPRKVGQ